MGSTLEGRVLTRQKKPHKINAYKILNIKQEVNKMNLKPLGNRLVIKQAVAEETTKSGIVLTGQTKEKPQQAEVLAVGPEVKGELKVGDTVVYSKYAGSPVKVDEVEYIIVSEEDVLAVLM